MLLGRKKRRVTRAEHGELFAAVGIHRKAFSLRGIDLFQIRESEHSFIDQA